MLLSFGWSSAPFFLAQLVVMAIRFGLFAFVTFWPTLPNDLGALS